MEIANEIADQLSDTEKRLLGAFLDNFFLNIKSPSLKDAKINLSINNPIEENSIPCSIFTIKLGALEAIVKYLHENKNLSLKKISQILHKKQNNVAVSYRNSFKKMQKKFSDVSFKDYLPFEIFSEKSTCMQSVCIYLKENKGLSYHKIAEILNRDERTIWTIYNKAKGGKK